MSRTLPAAKKRIESLDVMRGLTVALMILVNNSNEIICTSGLIEEFTLANKSYSLRFTE